jgi:hypothetical protein
MRESITETGATSGMGKLDTSMNTTLTCGVGDDGITVATTVELAGGGLSAAVGISIRRGLRLTPIRISPR